MKKASEVIIKNFFTETAKVEDAQGISDLLRDNFDNADAYEYLTKEEKEKYKSLNTKYKIEKKLKDSLNIVKLVIKDANGKIIGFRLAKKEKLVIKNELLNVLTGKRRHISRNYTGKGLGSMLLEETFRIAKENNLGYVTAIPSNDKAKEMMMDKYGYIKTEEYSFKGPQKVPIMIKQI